MECRLWVSSGPSELYHPDDRYWKYSGPSNMLETLDFDFRFRLIAAVSVIERPTALNFYCVILICAAYACQDDRSSLALAIDLAVAPLFEDPSDGPFPRLPENTFVLLPPGLAGSELRLH